MFEFLKNRPSVVHRVRFLRQVIASDVDGVSCHRSIGDEIEVTAGDAGSLIADGAVKDLGTVTAGGVTPPRKTIRQKPAEYEREPMPERFKSLDKWFAAAWEHQEDRRKLRHDVDNAASIMKASPSVAGENESRAWIKLREDLQEAQQKLRKHREAGEPRSVFECGKCVISEIRSANGICEALNNTAFAIFSHRLAALQLSPAKVQSLYGGSADYVKYFTQPMSTHDLRSAGGFEYIDAGLEQMATTILNARAFKAECYAKLEQAQAELDAARGVTKPSKKAA